MSTVGAATATIIWEGCSHGGYLPVVSTFVAAAHPQAFRTRGQQFADYLLREHMSADEPAWRRVERALVVTNRSEEWVGAFRDMTVLQLSRRLIHAGCRLSVQHNGENDVRDREIKQMILETMLVDWDRVGEVAARLEPAIHAARQPISPGLRAELEGHAMREMPFCYLCGADMEFGGESYLALTLDHVWPQAYGGQSDEDNLLPACKGCNERKADIPTWSMYPIQALIAGFDPTSVKLDALAKEIRFAVQARAAMTYASDNDVSLKQAYIDLGRVGTPSQENRMTTADVFSLRFQPA